MSKHHRDSVILSRKPPAHSRPRDLEVRAIGEWVRKHGLKRETRAACGMAALQAQVIMTPIAAEGYVMATSVRSTGRVGDPSQANGWRSGH